MPRVTVNVDRRQLERYRARARRDGQKLSVVLRAALTHYEEHDPL